MNPRPLWPDRLSPADMGGRVGCPSCIGHSWSDSGLRWTCCPPGEFFEVMFAHVGSRMGLFQHKSASQSRYHVFTRTPRRRLRGHREEGVQNQAD